MSIGSTWRKWNLHIHSPSTALNNQFKAIAPFTNKWDTYINQLSKTDTSVLAITDYYSVDGYLKVKEYWDAGKLPNIELLFPNIELRIFPSTEDGRNVNFHILCDPAIVSELEELLFSKLTFEYNGNQYSCTKKSLMALGREYNKTILDDNKALEEGVGQFKTDIKSLREIYRGNKKLQNHTITVVSNSSKDGASALKDSALTATRQEIYKFSSMIFSPRENDRNFFLGKGVLSPKEVIDQYGSLKPCIHGCDAHENNKICKPQLQRYTWIKADPTFSGLRQILYEPESRVYIGDNKPRFPTRLINEIKIDFPTGCKLDKEIFCFSKSYTLKLNPYFTCIIGGRGSGKSTLLNMIGKKLQSENKFFQNKQLLDSKGKKIILTDFIKIDEDKEEKAIEFLSQNEIEAFSEDKVKLTEAIYSRILGYDIEEETKEASSALDNALKSLHNAIIWKKSIRSKKSNIEKSAKEIESIRTIVASFESEDYKQLNEKAREIIEKINFITLSETHYINTIDSLKEILKNYKPLDTDNEYAIQSTQLHTKIGALVEEHGVKKFDSALSQRIILRGQYDETKVAIQKYLEKAGVSEEDQKDISNANSNIAMLTSQIEAEEIIVKDLEAKLLQFDVETAKKISSDFRAMLERHIQKIQETLDLLNTNKSLVKTINMSLDFDLERCNKFTFDEFKKLFEGELNRHKERSNFDDSALYRLLNSIPVTDLTTAEEFLEKNEADVSNTKAKGFLKSLFSDTFNFELYKLLLLKSRLDYNQFKIIQVLYDGRALEIASFGQRCTAAIIILLLLGNQPIIIDEPEAHLDSMLISNYLVEVIKTRKKHRQIIFATHNANFVVNGDAELIHVLETNDVDNTTDIESTTIENLKTTEKLIALEGGPDAFKKRENRYSSKTNL